MKKMWILASVLGILLSSVPSMSFAFSPKTAINWFMCDPIIKGNSVESYAAWVLRLNADEFGFSCYVYSNTRYNSYKGYLALAKARGKAVKLNEYDKRIQACKVGNTTFILGDLKCIFRVSFFPTSQPIEKSWNNVSKSFTNNQPMSYIPVAFKTITNAFDSMGGRTCSASGGNSLDYSVPLQKFNSTMQFIMPCQPPGALKVLRQYLVSFLYLGFALWIYAVAVKWWDKREVS